MTSDTVLSYPIPAYQNVPIHADYYTPRLGVITAITRGMTTTVTVATDTTLVVGQLVRFVMPPDSGTRQLNQLTGYVVSIPSSTQVVVNIDSQRMSAFTTPTSIENAQLVPVGDVNTGQINTGRTNNLTWIPGSFRNIS